MAECAEAYFSSREGEPMQGLALAHVLEGTSDCIMTFDHEWRFTFLNARAAAEIGPPETLLGKNVLDAYPRLAETPFWPAYQEAKKTGEPRRLEAYMPGLESWYEAYAAPTQDGMTIFFRNIDDLKKAEQAAAEREQQFTKILDHLPQMIWSTRGDGYHDYYNRLWYDFTGVPSGSTDGEGWNDMFHPDDQERACNLWHQSLASGDPYEIEYRLRHRSGDYRWVLRRAWPERNAAGQIVRWYGTCTDIHERVSAQAALRTSETLQQSVLDASADCIKVLGADGTLEFMNAPGCRAMDLDNLDAIRGKL